MQEREKPAIGREQAKDTGMALVLILLIAAYAGNHQKILLLALVVLVVDIIWPNCFYYPAKGWFGLAYGMSAITSRIILVLLFYGLVMPVGMMRRVLGMDPMRLTLWKRDNSSVFKDRDHLFRAGDIERPY